MSSKKKKFFFLSFITIPFVLIIFLALLYFFPTKNKGGQWDPDKIAIVMCVILLITAGVFGYFYLRSSYLNFEQNDAIKFEYNNKQQLQKLGIIGFITNFLDTIGIGSFAVSIMLLKLTKQNRSEKQLAGTLNLGHAIPSIVQAILFITSIKVEIWTLTLLIAAGVIGSYLGATFANKIKLGWAQLVIGIALVVIAIFIFLRQTEINVIKKNDSGHNSLQVWWKYLLGMIVFFILGVLQALGIGLYAPAMAAVYLFGLNGEIAFPIMSGVAAFVMPASALRFIKDKNYDPKIATSLTLGGVYGVLCSYLTFFYIIKGSLGVDGDKNDIIVNYFNWLIIIAIFYTASLFFYQFYKSYYKNTSNAEVKAVNI